VLDIDFAADKAGALMLEALDDGHMLATRRVNIPTEGGRASLLFAVAEGAVVTVRGHADGGLRGTVTGAIARGSRHAGEPALDLLPFLTLGPAGRHGDNGLAFDSTSEGFVFFGPYVGFPPGRYRVRIEIAGKPGWPWRRLGPSAIVDVVDGSKVLAEAKIPSAHDMRTELNFVLGGDSPPAVEVRLRKPSGMAGRVRSVMLERRPDPTT
jgi:hypothetical protein